MYLERKIDQFLIDWKNKKRKMPALIVGLRQCGKTESIKNFGKTYTNFIEINFWNNPASTSSGVNAILLYSLFIIISF